ncbi:VOC family protein [Spirillospora sp. NPDC029432]|uniref:VOC family protein n=1 Tax=Spirillospora sp. NPDC029432 TaxID=3154599 RepID=UPI0034552AC7
MTTVTTSRVPEHYRYSAVPHLMIEGAAEAIAFYERAFGAEEVFRLPGPDGTIMHAEISIEGSVLMLGDAGDVFAAPSRTGSTTVALHVYIADVDALHERALKEGATSLMAPADMPYGARQIMLRDPFGHVWVFLTHLRDVAPEEIVRAMG